MLDVRNPEIKVEDIMRRIQEKVRLRREQGGNPPRDYALPIDSMLGLSQALSQAHETAQVGLALPPMSRTRWLKRLIAAEVGRFFLRVAQVITRDQRTFNQAILSALQMSLERTDRFQSAALRKADEQAKLSRELVQRLDHLETTTRTLGEQLSAQRRGLGKLRSALSMQERRLTALLEEAKRRLPDRIDQQQLQAFADELPRIGDAAYLEFEDSFRGSREDIRRKVSIYLPKLREAVGPGLSPILDLGCGRGELIEVLREAGLTARGVDSNRAVVEQCQSLHLEVKLGDLFETLREVPEGSLGGLTALHVVEHLPHPLVLQLLDDALRVLRPGGLLIFETPNPLNILVGAANFYADPTHRNPVHPQTLHHLLEMRGFVEVETVMLHPYGPEMQVEENSEVARRFNQYFYGPQDYAVLGRRP